MSQKSESAAFERLAAVIRELRQKCPWDREQTYGTLGNHLLEEAYEVVDAIERGDTKDLEGELGDVLAQLLAIAVIGEESGAFSVKSILEEVEAKLVHRHPHVYSGTRAETAEQVVRNWEAMKQAERRDSGMKSALDGITLALPALVRAEKLGRRAKAAGMDWSDARAVLSKVREELAEVEQALAQGREAEAVEEIGDMLLALGNVPRFLNANAEEALRKACNKFSERFRRVEILAAKTNRSMYDMNATELDSLWETAKRG